MIAQHLLPFPQSVVKPYLEEQYGSSCTQALLSFQALQGSSPDSIIRHYLIRIAYLSVWADQNETLINQAERFKGFWQLSIEANKYKPTPNENADYLSVQATLAYYANRNQAAIDTMLMAIETRQATNAFEKAILADGYQFLGNLYKKQADAARAMTYFREAIRINRTIQRHESNYQLYVEMAQPKIIVEPNDSTILQNLKAALTHFTEKDNRKYMATCHNEIGNYWHSKERIHLAVKHFQYFVDYEEAQTEPGNLHIAYNNLATALNQIGEYERAKQYLVKAKSLTRTDDYIQNASFLSNLGALYGKLNQPDSALFFLDQAIQILFPGQTIQNDSVLLATRFDHPVLPIIISNKAKAQLELGKIQENVDLVRSSLALMTAAIDRLDRLRYMSSYNTKTISVKEHRDIYLLALETGYHTFQTSKNPTDLQSVFEFSYKSKSAIFDEYQRMLLAKDSIDLDRVLITRDDSLKQRQAIATHALLDLQRDPAQFADSINALYSHLASLENEISLLAIDMVNANPYYFNSINNPDAITYNEIQDLLNTDEIILDYTLSPTGLFVVIISKQSAEVCFHRISNQDHENISQFNAFFSRRSDLGFTNFIDLGYDLFQLLIGQAGIDFTNKQLIIIPDGPLGYLPFDAMSVSNRIPSRRNYSETDLLIHHSVVSYQNSIQQFKISRTKPLAPPAEIIAFAPFTNSNYTEGLTTLNKLEGSRAEVDLISNYIRTRIYKGRRASLRQFVNYTGSNHILHLATHGILSMGNPMNNHLIFSPNQKTTTHSLPLYQVSTMSIDAPMVVLSACHTGGGDLYEGEGIMSLTRGFHSAGVDAVVMSLWPAFDQPAVIIMGKFYENLSTGTGPAEALRNAKLSYLDTCTSSFSHPALWSNYQLSGLNDPIQVRKQSGNPRNSLILLSSLAILLLVVWLFLHKRKRVSNLQ